MINFCISRYIFYLLFFLLATFFSRYPVTNGEDITNARNNFIFGSKIDFWGGASSLIYGNFPDTFMGWQNNLILLQLLICSIALYILLNKLFESRIRFRFLVVVFTYLNLIIASQATRDGLLYSFLLLGISVIHCAIRQQQINIKLVIFGLAAISLGMSLRPWLSPALIPIILHIFFKSKTNLSKKFLISTIFFVLLCPLFLESASSKVLKLKSSFPAQQVMLMDFAGTYCSTNNSETGRLSESGLKYFLKSDSDVKKICQFFRSDTYLSLFYQNNVSSEGLSLSIDYIEPSKTKDHHDVTLLWVKMISQDPLSYFQNKVIFFNRLAIGSDTRGLEITTADNLFDFLQGFYKIVYDLVISFHVLSVYSLLFLLAALTLRKSVKLRTSSVVVEWKVVIVSASCFLWVLLSAVVFVGSNGRYTYSVTLLGITYLLLPDSIDPPPKQAREKLIPE